MTEMTSIQQDFANAIEVNHLTNEQLDQLLKLFEDK